MNKDETYFYNRNNLEKIYKEHPEYTKIYFKIQNQNGKLLLGIQKDSGDELYILSNKNHENLKQYLSKKALENYPIKKKTDQVAVNGKIESVKKPKQQTLFGFIQKK